MHDFYSRGARLLVFPLRLVSRIGNAFPLTSFLFLPALSLLVLPLLALFPQSMSVPHVCTPHANHILTSHIPPKILLSDIDLDFVSYFFL